MDALAARIEMLDEIALEERALSIAHRHFEAIESRDRRLVAKGRLVLVVDQHAANALALGVHRRPQAELDLDDDHSSTCTPARRRSSLASHFASDAFSETRSTAPADVSWSPMCPCGAT